MCDLCKITPYERAELVRDAIKMGNSVSHLEQLQATENIVTMSESLYGTYTIKLLMCSLIAYYGYSEEFKFNELTDEIIINLWDIGVDDFDRMQVKILFTSLFFGGKK